MKPTIINIDEVKQLATELSEESDKYCCVQFIASKFLSNEAATVDYSLSVGDYSSGLMPSIPECVAAYNKSKTDVSAMEHEAHTLEARAASLRAEIEKRRANLPSITEAVS